MKKENEKVEKPIEKKILLQQEFLPLHLISVLIESLGPKKVLSYLLKYCAYNTFEKSIFPSSLLSTEKDEEMAEATAVLHYIMGNWKEVSDRGMESITKNIKNSKSPTE